MHKSLKPVWLLIAALLLLEAWLWARLIQAGRGIVRCLPFDAFKARIARAVENLPPLVVLPIPLIPATIIVPLKIGGLWLIGHKHFVSGAAAFSGAELVGLCLGAVLFDLCRDKLLTLGWFRWIYLRVLAAWDWAHALLKPYRRAIAVRVARARRIGWRALAVVWPRGGGGFGRRLWMLRMRIRRVRQIS